MKLLSFLFLFLFYLGTHAQTGIYTTEMAECDTLVTDFMTAWNITGLSFAMSKDGKLVYHRAFGTSDVAETVPAYPYNLYRVASNSKPITSIAIMKLYENGQLAMSDKVFGTGGILESHPILSGASITDARIYDITVQQLLEHSAGWNRGNNCFPNPTTPYPWWFSGCDPLVVPLHVTQENGTTNPVTNEDNIVFLLEKGLDFTPGTGYYYSNVGFVVLGEIIESVSGMSYENYVRTNILDPIHAYDLIQGKNLLADKKERETEYVGNGYTTLDLYGSGSMVPWEYGGFSIEAFEAPSGWIANTRDYCRLLVAIDNFATVPDILNSSTIDLMTTPSSNFAFYAKGWQVNGADNWWHVGSLDGTACVVVRTNHGYTWSIVTNKRIPPSSSSYNTFINALDGLPWNCLAATVSYPTFDLFETPTVNTSDLNFMVLDNTSVELNWMSGDGDSRIIVAKEGSPVDMYPVDGEDYIANGAFGSGDDLGNNNFIVYDGNMSTATVSNLTSGSTYYFRIFEYNQNTTTGNHKLYMLPMSENVRYYSGCIDDLTVSDFNQDLYKANMTIQSSECNNTMDVIFQAGQEIELHPGFCIEANLSFEAIISSCN